MCCFNTIDGYQYTYICIPCNFHIRPTEFNLTSINIVNHLTYFTKWLDEMFIAKLATKKTLNLVSFSPQWRGNPSDGIVAILSYEFISVEPISAYKLNVTFVYSRIMTHVKLFQTCAVMPRPGQCDESFISYGTCGNRLYPQRYSIMHITIHKSIWYNYQFGIDLYDYSFVCFALGQL